MSKLKVSKDCIDVVTHFEGIHDGDLSKIGLQPKLCPSGIWTIGFGHALKDINGSWLKGIEGYKRMLEIYPDLETITIEEATQLLDEDLDFFEGRVNSLNLNLTQYQFDALVSFAFNCGFGNLLSSTLLKRVRGDKGSIYDAFLMWNKSNGRVLNGLIARRVSEATLFINGIVKF